MRTPSVKTLREVFNDRAPEAKRVFQMTRAELEQTPAGEARVRECFHPPKRFDLRLAELNRLAETYGVEHIQFVNGEFASYLNAGETYAPTVIFWRGRYRVQSMGDFVERVRVRAE